eukprot:XP_020397879.1 aspartate and glycine-rich protein-like [Zea mays]
MGRRHEHGKTRKKWFGKMNRALAAAEQPAHACGDMHDVLLGRGSVGAWAGGTGPSGLACGGHGCCMRAWESKSTRGWAIHAYWRSIERIRLGGLDDSEETEEWSGGEGDRGEDDDSGGDEGVDSSDSEEWSGGEGDGGEDDGSGDDDDGKGGDDGEDGNDEGDVDGDSRGDIEGNDDGSGKGDDKGDGDDNGDDNGKGDNSKVDGKAGSIMLLA